MREAKQMWMKLGLLHGLALVVLVLTCADHWTTYVCLRAPVGGWEVVEANPLAEWLFGSTGLVPGLALDTLITFAAIGFLMTTDRFSRPMKASFLSIIALATGYAVANNLQAIQAMGLSAIGFSA